MNETPICVVDKRATSSCVNGVRGHTPTNTSNAKRRQRTQVNNSPLYSVMKRLEERMEKWHLSIREYSPCYVRAYDSNYDGELARSYQQKVYEALGLIGLAIDDLENICNDALKDDVKIHFDTNIDGHWNTAPTPAICALASMCGSHDNVDLLFKTGYGFSKCLWFIISDLMEAQDRSMYSHAPYWWEKVKNATLCVYSNEADYNIRVLVVVLHLLGMIFREERIDTDKANEGLGTITLAEARALEALKTQPF